MTPQSAVVLAAGEGTRLSPLTETRPKPMLPVANKPLLDHVVTSLSDAGIERVVLVVGHHREVIQAHLGDGSDWGVDIEYVLQEPRNGTGHALLQAESHVSGTFVVINGDRIVESSLIRDLVKKYEETGNACLAVTRVDNPSDYGIVSTEDGHVAGIVEKPLTYDTASSLANIGVYVFGPEIFAGIRQTERRGELGLTDVLDRQLDRLAVNIVRYDGPWLDLTEPWDLLSVNAGVLDTIDPQVAHQASIHDQATVSGSNVVGSGVDVAAGSRVLRECAIGDGVQVGANTVLSNVVILPDVRIGHGTVLQDCIIGQGATIGANVTVGGGKSDVVLNGEVYPDARLGGVIGDSVTIGDAVTVDPGTVIGNRTAVQGGSTIQGTINFDTDVRRG